MKNALARLRKRLDRGRLFPAGARPPVVNAFALTLAGLGLLALAAPLGDAEQPLQRVGTLLMIAGGLEILHGVRRADAATLHRAVTSGIITVLPFRHWNFVIRH